MLIGYSKPGEGNVYVSPYLNERDVCLQALDEAEDVKLS
jgi:hypothetical protein